MIFFINKGLFEREWNFEITSVNGKTQFSIPEYVEKKRRHYQLYFLFDGIVSTEDLKENLFVKRVTMEKVKKDMYYLAKTTEKNNDGVYALLRSTGVVPDDIFIPKDKKEKVEVIRRIRYLDTEAEIGEFLANIYLIKVKLEKDESIPIYYAYRKTRCLTKHDVIYRSSLHKNEYSVETGLTTWIMLNDKNKSDYISLSKLC
ncbi:MAG: hypothetical protein BHW02_06700 [Clostridium sp. 28_12]|nr:MAG: hypothetical protein BHW02_06700 [Clostridium sp. 28_12]